MLRQCCGCLGRTGTFVRLVLLAVVLLVVGVALVGRTRKPSWLGASRVSDAVPARREHELGEDLAEVVNQLVDVEPPRPQSFGHASAMAFDNGSPQDRRVHVTFCFGKEYLLPAVVALNSTVVNSRRYVSQ